ncbi:hypothetical protein Dda_5200 [Drechslerella dactyloides]|uniref:Uncharacterized protein n=1 Tax=Drechslerella dactyloides TaxID=74499 RepID=A0AAD6IVM8_DREDA|nr:hypothetical protein Dda_5200 [Drechslerella dactyloides]
MQAKSFPSPYKLVITRNETDPANEAHVSIFDCMTDPIPRGNGNDTRLSKLSHCCSTSLILFEKVLRKINAGKELEGTGCKYYLVAMDINRWRDAKETDEGNWRHRSYALKLANSEAIFRDAIGAPIHNSGTNTPDASEY